MDTGAFMHLAMVVIPLVAVSLLLAASIYLKSWGLAFVALALMIFPVLYWAFLAMIFLTAL